MMKIHFKERRERMSELLRKARNTFLSEKFIGSCLIGIINTFNTAFFSWLFHFILQENFAAYLGFFLSLTVNYLLNSHFVFKNHLHYKKYIKFLISYIPNFIIFFLVSFITINLLEMDQFWATVLATAAGGPVTFVIIKLYAFSR